MMYKIILYGRVHDVGMRAAVCQLAIQNRLKGIVRNTEDAVEIIVNDKDFIKKLESLPIFSRVENYTIDEHDVVGARYKEFRIMPTEY